MYEILYANLQGVLPSPRTVEEFDSIQNRLVGFSLPLNDNGLPDANKSVITCVEDIINMYTKMEKASVVFVIMAQPISDCVPPFRICAFGSNNKFTTVDVQRRVAAVENQLSKVGIQMISYCTDGDSREMKFMRLRMNFGTTTNKG